MSSGQVGIQKNITPEKPISSTEKNRVKYNEAINIIKLSSKQFVSIIYMITYLKFLKLGFSNVI